jgi:hypothetical protein
MALDPVADCSDMAKPMLITTLGLKLAVSRLPRVSATCARVLAELEEDVETVFP